MLQFSLVADLSTKFKNPLHVCLKAQFYELLYYIKMNYASICRFNLAKILIHSRSQLWRHIMKIYFLNL